MKRILKFVFAISLITCMVFTSVMPAFAATKAKTYYVTASSGLNVRSGAGTSYRKVALYSYAAKVTSTQQKKGWHKTSKGWVSGDYLSTKNPKSSSSSKKTYYVTASVLNVRSGAGTSYKKVASYKKGAKVESTQQKNGWHKTAKGWVSGDYLSTKKPGSSSSTTTKPNSKAKTYYVTASVLNVRSGAGTSYKKVASYKKGTKVESTQQKNGWHKTAKGWVSGDYLSTKKPASNDSSTNDAYVKSVSSMRVTAYCAGTCCNGSWSNGNSSATASGVRLYNSSKYANKYCAATPAVGKLGQSVQFKVSGKTYNLEIVDRLGSSSGKVVDVFVPSHSQTRKFGSFSGVSGKIYE